MQFLFCLLPYVEMMRSQEVVIYICNIVVYFTTQSQSQGPCFILLYPAAPIQRYPGYRYILFFNLIGPQGMLSVRLIRSRVKGQA